MSKSLYERLGGEPAVLAAVARFYERIIADELTRPFFEGLDVHAQVKKQVAFMSIAFGGPHEYHGRDLTEAHVKLVKEKGLSDAHFDRVATHLEATLEELGVPEELVEEAMEIVGATREKVLGR